MSEIKLTKVCDDGKYVFCRDGTYFSVTRRQAKSMVAQIDEARLPKGCECATIPGGSGRFLSARCPVHN